ncbi:MAG: SsrA-binding protein SmpB [Acidobacteriota bacterium]
MAKPTKDEIRELASNRQARRDYEIEDTFEAGMVLLGTEVKSCRLGRVQLKDAYARPQGDKVVLYKLHIAHYTHASVDANHDPERPRTLLLKAHEIRRLIGKSERAGYTLIPLRVYLKGAWIKVELALARGRSTHEKRDAIKRKMVEREVRQEMSRRR